MAIAVALVAVCSSCIEDGFTTSPSDVLAFNCDTLAFDTVITLQGTATKQMVVYNRSKKQINISSIEVAGLATKGHFHLNVDGIRGDSFQNVEIRGNDSIFIFIQTLFHIQIIKPLYRDLLFCDRPDSFIIKDSLIHRCQPLLAV